MQSTKLVSFAYLFPEQLLDSRDDTHARVDRVMPTVKTFWQLLHCRLYWDVIMPTHLVKAEVLGIRF